MPGVTSDQDTRRDNVCLHLDSKQKNLRSVCRKGRVCKELSWFCGLSQRKVDIRSDEVGGA